MKLHEILQFGFATIPLFGIIWQIAEMKSAIYKYIDNAISERDDRIHELEKILAIHKELYEERKDFVDYQLHGIRESVAHKYNRCLDEIKTLKNSK